MSFLENLTMPKVEEPNGPNKKVWDQIEEILEEDERKGPQPIRIARPVAPRKVHKVRSRTSAWYPTPEKLIVAGLVLMVIAVALRNFVLPLTLGGFALAGIGYYMLVMRKRRNKFGSSTRRPGAGDSSPKYWRGKPVKPSGQVKKRDGNILEFPDSLQGKKRSRFGRKR